MRTKLGLAGGLGLALALAGCGSGNEPLSILGDPTSTPSLGLPLSNTTSTNSSFGWQVTPFDTTQNPPITGFQFTNFNFSSGAQTVLAPGTGTVTSVTTSANSQGTTIFAVTIAHNIHVSSQVSQIASATVRVGDYVTAGQAIGLTATSFSPTNVIAQLSVIVDGNTVCPYSYLAGDARNLINSHNFVTGPGGAVYTSGAICKQ